MQSFSGNEEFFFQGGKQGIVLVHGYTGAPGEMRLLGEYLHQQGLTVLGVRLAGHGTTPQDLNETKWQDWYKAVSDGVYRLQAGCDRVRSEEHTSELQFFYPLPEKTSAPVSGAGKLQRLLSYDAGQAAEQPV